MGVFPFASASCRINLLIQLAPMKVVLSFIAIFLLSSFAYSQSGRRGREIKAPVAASAPEVNEQKQVPAPQPEVSPVTAEKNQDYRCTDDGSLARILDTEITSERIISPKEADTRAVITGKPKPSYTTAARRNGVQGFVTLKVLLSADNKISRVRVVKGLPAGLTENAIRAACKMEFKPATKDGHAVSQWVTADYVFRLADSSIFAP
jgi:TonB family protein